MQCFISGDWCKYTWLWCDYWCGVRSMTARKLKPEEVKAWEEQAPTERATYLFIRGMLEITAKAYAERGCAV